SIYCLSALHCRSVTVVLQWIHYVKRKNWRPKKYSRLCSLHFTQDCFIPVQGRNTLKADAVPTIFYPHCQAKVKVRHTRVSKNTSVASCSHSHSADHGAYTLKKSHSPLKRKVSFGQSSLRPYKKKLKLQTQRVRRLKQKVKSLSSVVTDLKEKLLISTSCADMLEECFY
uniref:THAP domain-containing protein 1 n=1 Tax=Cyprinus carpio TaxID=7962 RepID=A0A8C1TJJ5_CYPCA